MVNHRILRGAKGVWRRVRGTHWLNRHSEEAGTGFSWKCGRNKLSLWQDDSMMYRWDYMVRTGKHR